METVRYFIFLSSKITEMVISAMKLKDASSLEENDKPRQCIKKQRDYFTNKGPSSQSYGFSSSHVWMWELDYKESWAPRNWCICTSVLEKTLESPLDCKEIQPVHPKDISPEYSLKGLMLNLKLQYFGHLMQKPTHWEIPWCWKRLKAGGEGDDRGWDGWMASLTQWTWVWISSGSWWWTGKSGVLQSMGSQRVGSDWETELSWTWCTWHTSVYFFLCTFHSLSSMT